MNFHETFPRITRSRLSLFACAAVVVALLAGAATARALAEQPPNVVFILADDMRSESPSESGKCWRIARKMAPISFRRTPGNPVEFR